MSMRVFKTFCDVVDTASFSRAAEVNGISQSAVSQQLGSLESSLGAQLLHRGGGFVAPTEAGKAFYRAAKDILRRYEMMLGEVRSARDAVRGVLRVGTIYSVGFYLLARYIRQFLRGHPEVELHVDYTHWSRINAAVLNGEMDLGVVAYPEKQRGIEVIPLVDEDLVIVMPPNHPLAGRKKMEPKELEGQKFVAFEAHIPTRRAIDKLLRSYDVEVDVAMEFDNIETLKRAVEVETGLSILPRKNIQNELSYGHLTYASFDDPEPWVRNIGILRRRGKASSPAESMFLSLLRSASTDAAMSTTHRPPKTGTIS